MARAQGARARMALAFETTYGTPPASGFTTMPFAAATLGGEAPLLASELLGYGRDPLAPQIDALNVDGTVTVPVDAAGIGYWLKGAFGDPTTTGGSTYTRVFTSGDWDLPSMAIEIGMPEVPDFTMYTGCKVDSIAFSMQRAGLLTAQVSLIAQDQARADATAAGSPAALTMSRFGQFLGAVSRNGSALGDVVSAEFTYANNLDRIEVLRGDGLIAGADPSMAAFTGRMTVRYSSQVLADQAVAGDPCSLSFAWSKSASESLTVLAHREAAVPEAVNIGGRAAEGFARGFETNLLSVPDLGLEAVADAAQRSAGTWRQAAEDLAAGATAPIESWGALRDAVTGSGREGAEALAEAAGSADRLTDALDAAEDQAGRTGAAVRGAAGATGAAAEEAAKAMGDYARLSEGVARDVEGAFRSAFTGLVTGATSAQAALGQLLGKLADVLANRAFDLLWRGGGGGGGTGGGGGLGGFFGRIFGGLFAPVMHTGGTVSFAGAGRSVPALAFAGAPRMHAGGWAGLRPDEVPAILQRGERVIPRNAAMETAAGGGTVEVMVKMDGEGNLRPLITRVAGNVVARAAPGIVQSAVGAAVDALTPDTHPAETRAGG